MSVARGILDTFASIVGKAHPLLVLHWLSGLSEATPARFVTRPRARVAPQGAGGVA